MKRLLAWSALLVVSSSAQTAVGISPRIDPPTPPPCAADGTCYPNTGGWGYYAGRWRVWPGGQLVPTPSAGPTPIEGRVSEELGNSELPPQDMEDAAAPPSSPHHEEKPGEAAPAEGAEKSAPEAGRTEPPTAPFPGVERSPLGPTSRSDPPPRLPRMFARMSPSASRHQAVVPVAARAASSRISTNDPPPSPPWGQSASL